MNEIEELRKSGLLPTDKQYKKLLAAGFMMIISPAVFLLTGMMLMIFATEFQAHGYEIFVTGCVLTVVSFVILLFNIGYAWIHFSPKIYTYRDYKKHPENYEEDV